MEPQGRTKPTPEKKQISKRGWNPTENLSVNWKLYVSCDLTHIQIQFLLDTIPKINFRVRFCQQDEASFFSRKV